MIDSILSFSIRRRYLVVLLWLAVVAAGLYSAWRLPIDAVPDVTTNQVQVNTLAPGFSPLEVERYVTVPVELALSSLPRKTGLRSISQFGLSQVTVTFEEGADLYWARQLVLERIIEAERSLPPGIAPRMAPISTGLGEILHFTVEEEPESPLRYSLMELRTILDWTIKPALRDVPGVIDVNSFGGRLKQYEVLVDPDKLVGHDLTLSQVVDAVRAGNSNVGGAYLERGGEQQLVRGVGLIQSPQDIGDLVVAARDGTPVKVGDVAKVGLGSAVRQGAATRDGQGETVMGIAMLLKGENSRTVTQDVRRRLREVQASLPEGVRIRPFYDRSQLVSQTIRTAAFNLLEGGLLVIAVLFLFLLQLRAGLIVSSAIPLSMLFAVVGMHWFGISANLMSLGAIDFGLIVDAAVIIVENSVRHLAQKRKELGRDLTVEERLRTVFRGSSEVRRASQFGEMIIIAAYLPVVSLAGMEGKMFRPMALTVILALSGALVLSLTLVPALSAIFLKARRERRNYLLQGLLWLYRPLLKRALRLRWITASAAVAVVAASLLLFPLLGSEFLPELDEGALAVNHVRLKSAALSESVRQTTLMEAAIKGLPEVQTVVSRIGRPEIATDPMGPDMVDTYVFLKPRGEWRKGIDKAGLTRAVSERLERFPGVVSSFSQPIKFRMMELIEGVGARSDVVIKIFGDDMDVLLEKAAAIGDVVRQIPGARDVKVQQVTGLPMLQVRVLHEKTARYGIRVSDVQQVVEAAIAGIRATVVLEGFKRFDAVVRLMPESRDSAEKFGRLLVSAPGGAKIPLNQLAAIESIQGPAEVSRENGRRRISVEANVRARDIGSFVQEAKGEVDRQVGDTPGYSLQWGGTFEHLESGRNRLMIAVPATFLLVFSLLFATFGSLRQAAAVFTGIPFALSGGVLALLLRDMHFSMSAGIGFIAVSGVAVLNGVVLVTFLNRLRAAGRSLAGAVYRGALNRLRPVLMTATVASLGLLPMALSTSTGAEVQRPLATVVIGGLITSTLLTLLVLPGLYCWIEKRSAQRFQSPQKVITQRNPKSLQRK
ncbi:MAG TPA: CusA/CzcA family heavy metal efflux RND transporter [Acidobacteriota bacterium]|nr:CusA/CzcA family heavy metal efflux RND transporter [Acidobacteriota bacterium]